MLDPTFPYWVLPVVASATWGATLSVLLGYWFYQGKPHLSKMKPLQTYPLISDVGGVGWPKWVFVIGTLVSAGTFSATSILLARWVVLYIPGSYFDISEGLLMSLTVAAAALSTIGGAGAVLLAYFDKYGYKGYHHFYLGVFMFSSTTAAIFILVVASYLDYKDIDDLLAASYYLKISLTGAGFISSVIFAATTKTKNKRDTAAVAEWSTAAIFVLYMASFVLDMIAFPRPEDEDSDYYG